MAESGPKWRVNHPGIGSGYYVAATAEEACAKYARDRFPEQTGDERVLKAIVAQCTAKKV